MIRKRIFEHKKLWVSVFSFFLLLCVLIVGLPKTANADSDIISNEYMVCDLGESVEDGGFRTDYISTTDTAVLNNEYLPWSIVFYLNNADMSVQTNVSIDIKQFSENILTVELDDLVSSKYSFDSMSNTVTHSDGYWKIRIKNKTAGNNCIKCHLLRADKGKKKLKLTVAYIINDLYVSGKAYLCTAFCKIINKLII